MAKQVNFEVQVMQGGRWTIHARYPEAGKEEAVEEAKQLSESKVGDVRVLRDVYDADTGMSSEFTIYSSAGVSKASSGGGGSSYNADSDEDEDEDEDEDDDEGGYTDIYDDEALKEKKRQKKEKKKRQREEARKSGTQTSMTSLFVKLLFIILLAVCVAMVSVFTAGAFLDGVNIFGVLMNGPAKENAMIYLFLFMFVATSLMLSSVLLGNSSLKARKRRPPPSRRSQSTSTNQPTIAAQSRPQTHLDAPDTSSLAFASQDDEDDEDDSHTEAPDEPSEDAIDPGSMTDDKEPDEDSAGPGGLSPHEEKQKAYMMKFISSAMEGTGQDKKSMSNFDKFGVSLFLAGACETMAQKSDVSDAAKSRIMADSVQTMGFKRDHAASFSQKYDEYLVQDPTYMQMFQAGRNAMNTYLTDESRISKNMGTSMTEWNKPKVKEEQSGPITVLFTDIAGSTAMTQDLGDAGAQEVVRAHNRVVREALTMWNGKEVKHTGDGIIASFVKTSDSLDAAMQMQRESAEHTAQQPTRPLFLKIGINSGEPIAEDNDLFGSTVQMSARIVDKALKEEIFVSEIVRGICAGKTYKFKNRGTYPMKGFDTDPVLYEVLWREE